MFQVLAATKLNTQLVSLNQFLPPNQYQESGKEKQFTQCYCAIKQYLYRGCREVILGIAGSYNTVTHLLLLNARAQVHSMCIAVLEMFQ